MEEAAKETVIIVHGTWAGLEAGKNRWWQLAEPGAAQSFTAKLDAALKDRGSPARCWAHCVEGDQPFHWSPGANDWLERTHAAARLADYVANLQNKGWECHLIGHSHGGNVVLEAAASDEPLGKLVTLGTPFLDTMSPYRRSAQRLRKVISTASAIGWFLSLLVSNFFISGMDWKNMALFWGTILAIGLGAKLIYRFIGKKPRKEVSKVSTFLSAFSRTPQFHTPLLAIGSPMDEAWQLLHHLGTIENPLAIRSGVLRYLFSSVRSQMARNADIAHIRGAKSYGDVGITTNLWLALMYVLSFTTLAMVVFLVTNYPTVGLIGTSREIAEWLWPQNLVAELVFLDPEDAKNIPDTSTIAVVILLLFVLVPLGVLVFFFNRANAIGPDFYSAFFSPFRWCLRLLSALRGTAKQFMTYLVRRKSWPVLLEMAMGLEGYRFPIPLVEQAPRNIPKAFVKYEDLPKGAQERAMKKRTDWITGHLGDVSETFAKMAITAADISTLLQKIVEDEAPVHAAYYTDDECIARIADWIADKDDPPSNAIVGGEAHAVA